jgi:hypothetical protein
VSDRPMIIGMRTTSRPQQRYDHRLRDLVHRTRGRDHRHGSRCPALDGAWVARCSADRRGQSGVAGLTEPELRQEILKLRRRVE